MPSKLSLSRDLVLGLLDAAEAVGRAAALRLKEARRPAPRRGVGRTLRPGVNTPLWNELVKQAVPQLTKYGSKVQLARLLGLPRQRVQDCLKARHAALDAERTLLLLCWVSARQQGRDLMI